MVTQEIIQHNIIMLKPNSLRRYKAILHEFMIFLNGSTYPEDKTFSQDELLATTDADVVSFLNQKDYGTTDAGEHDCPVHSCSSTLLL